MNCTNLSHFSVSYDNLNSLITIRRNSYYSFATLNGFGQDSKTYLEENVLPYFSYIKVTATGKFDTVGSITSGHIELLASYRYNQTASLFNTGSAVMDTVDSPMAYGSSYNMSGSAYFKINQGIWSTYPYISTVWARIWNKTSGQIEATITSVKFEFAKTNS